ncbi:2-hydroxy-3-oxopropionate reductase [Stutzerimonas kunmingensis]|jgi:2-hydroxy-3-oxopropionate reductase|uniref:2-hydroxy-3-oxopropionate reductase n=1 Tax=Stutzerimonas stutzeri subgroup TaxID=578833 RepID=UPI0005B4075F|nr:MULTISPECIES: 2-hydroxy-3-oxopropionate reductase [Stutzerimonas stutzeri group]KKJ94911.1 tartronate semialdehyde reductase [Stutzerimonas stutzeri]MAF87451.1 2-hydroxy-3-oxopropionate reductase [Pseudomonas sp.]KJS80128.1 MAG: tartronate semialdehyde reductase [[Pseudomonas] sp. BICA1-14]MAK87508.1 2-hydroxy-3-oxopropionate reductase [Pseudomonas sp.]MBD3875429.1 2-hydroxy-3-oxopropionate reductase [Stutzerimonas kunmingensis]|tara:strand:- start:18493 stop:19383 length:891 start_codon:yes stop_codon:yes gene_type:complete
MAKIGFIGTGIMGKPMASNLQNAGHQIFLSEHHDKAPADLVQAGAIALATPQEVAQEAEFIIVMVPDTPQVEDVLFRDQGIAAGVGPGKVVIDMSSISPSATKQFAEKIKASGAEYLDAPVSGGEVGAKAGSLSIMVGGSEAAFERALPLFQAMGKNITRVGENGDGQTAKVANQIIVALNIQAVAEALLFAAKNGADPAKVREALMGGFAGSKILEVHGERMIKGTFDPGFRISLHQKDLNLALAGARELGLNLPNTANAQQVFSTCAAIGGSGWDHSALIKGLEHMANFSIRKE